MCGAGTGIQGSLVQYDWLSLNSLVSCSRTETASGSSKNDTSYVSSTLTYTTKNLNYKIMAIGIGLHCWYCDHGPCNGDCKNDIKNTKSSKDKEKETLDLLIESHKSRGMDLDDNTLENFKILAKRISML